MLALVVIYDECLSSYAISKLFSYVLKHEIVTFVELFCMYK
jgi:hypothetical protein